MKQEKLFIEYPKFIEIQSLKLTYKGEGGKVMASKSKAVPGKPTEWAKHLKKAGKRKANKAYRRWTKELATA